MNKIPKQIFVTARKEIDRVFDEAYYEQCGKVRYFDETYCFLGFLHPHEPTKKADAKRKKTQMEWAYGPEKNGYNQINHEVICGVVIENSPEYDQNTHRYNGNISSKKADFQPQILENVPLTGFEITSCRTRYTTNNKVYRVKDPRGFETEITAQCLLGILKDGEIEHGIIQNPCVWVGNKNLQVVK